MSSDGNLGVQAFSVSAAVGVNVLIFASMLLMGMGQEEEAPPPEIIEVDLVEVARKGEKPPDPKALPRIVKPPAPPPEETDAVSISRKKKAEELEKKKKEEEKKRRLAEEKRRNDERKKKKLERKRQRDERKKRKRAIADALKRMDDPRADDEDAPGFKKGHALGRSTDPNAMRNKLLYATLIGRALESQFQVPNTIPDAIRKNLRVQVYFRISPKGKVRGRPQIAKSSGNKFFDRAALTTVRRFGQGSSLTLPLPKDKSLRKTVLRIGIKARMKGK